MKIIQATRRKQLWSPLRILFKMFGEEAPPGKKNRIQVAVAIFHFRWIPSDYWYVCEGTVKF